MQINKTKMLATLAILMGMAFATGYAENNTIANVLNASWDLAVAFISGIIGYVPDIIGVGLFIFFLGAISTGFVMIIGLLTIFTKFGKK